MKNAILETVGWIFVIVGCITAISAGIAIGVKLTIEFMEILGVVK